MPDFPGVAVASTGELPTTSLVGFLTGDPDSPREVLVSSLLGYGAPGAIDEETGTAYAAVAGDFGTTKEFNNASAITLTIPLDLDAGIDTVFEIHQTGAGVVTIAGAGGVTVQSRGGALTTAGQYAIAGIKCVAANVYRVTGDVTA